MNNGGTFLRHGVFLSAILVFRLRLLFLLKIDPGIAIHQGLLSGVLQDIAFSFLPFVVRGLSLSLSQRLSKWVSTGTALLIWICVCSYHLFFEYFKFPLEIQKVWKVSGLGVPAFRIILVLLTQPFVLLSLGLLLIYFILEVRSKPRSFGDISHRLKTSFIQTTTPILFCWVFLRMIVWFHIPNIPESALSEHVLPKWYAQYLQRQADQLEPQVVKKRKIAKAVEKLKEFRSSHGTSSDFTYHFKPDPSLARTLRSELGFKPDQKLNVILLFLESVRAFEFFHPELGPEVFPNLHKILANQGMVFKELYSSANYTVEGQFATLCSAINRRSGGSSYVSRPYLNVKCLPSLLAENGYATYWMNTYHKHFGNKYLFESHHGMQTFLDRETFKPRTPEEAQHSSEWGLADEPFYNQVFEKLTEIHNEHRPFFVHILNSGTHAPWKIREDFPIAEELRKEIEGDPQYLGYLTSLKALDSALGHFLERFMKSKMAENTVIVFSSDHGTGITPPYPKLQPVQRALLWRRILAGMISKNLNRPKIITRPSNQIDLVPLIATIAHASGEVTWLGRLPYPSGGSSWALKNGFALSYRTRDRFCQRLLIDTDIQCWEPTEAEDPLFTPSLSRPITEDPKLTETLSEVLDANELLIDQNSWKIDTKQESQI